MDKIIEESLETFASSYNYMENIEIEEKKLSQWKAYFNIAIPREVSIFELRELIVELNERLQICSDIYSTLKVSSQSLALIESNKNTELLNEVLSDKKIKHFNKAEAEAKLKNINLINSRKNNEIILEFFNDQLKKIQTTLKVLTLLNMNILGEAKIGSYIHTQ